MENSKKVQSLRKKSDFQQIKEKGKVYKPAPWLLVVCLNNDIKISRYGLTISKKIGKAVLRNKFKRWCREFFRGVWFQSLNLGLDINVVFLSTKEDFYKNLQYQEFNSIMSKLFKKDFRFYDKRN